MNAAPLHWFLHDSRTAHLVKRALCGRPGHRAFAECPAANFAVSAALAVGCAAIAMVLTGQW